MYARSGLIVIALIVVGGFLRLWAMGSYPDHVHHDHAIYGDAILRIYQGEWAPLFTRVYSIGKPWLAIPAASIAVFGAHAGTLRLTAGLTGTLLIWATYLLGSVWFSRRVGVIAATLVTFNHVLLLYSRQPYVIDPIAPFVLCLYAATVGFQRRSWVYWGVAGLLFGVSLTGYYSSVTFLPIGGVMLMYALCAYPRRLLRNAMGLAWFVVGALCAYGPMLRQASDTAVITHRLRNVFVFLDSAGNVRWDPSLWAYQISRAFGAICLYPDTGAWNIVVPEPMLLNLGAGLFALGLLYLLANRRTPGAFFVLSWIIVGIFLAVATLPDPPSYYHLLVAVVPVLLVCAVAVDRFLAFTDSLSFAGYRYGARIVVVSMLVVMSVTHVQALWAVVKRPTAHTQRAGAETVAAKYILEHPAYRYYLVRSENDRSVKSPNFQFFTGLSETSDISGNLGEALPVPATRAGVVFLFLPSRRASESVLLRTYPSAIKLVVDGSHAGGDLSAYLVYG